jgi:hypothetical protein
MATSLLKTLLSAGKYSPFVRTSLLHQSQMGKAVKVQHSMVSAPFYQIIFSMLTFQSQTIRRPSIFANVPAPEISYPDIPIGAINLRIEGKQIPLLNNSNSFSLP